MEIYRLFRLISFSLLFPLLASCTTSSTSFYGTKSTPAAVGALRIQISDESDNSELRGNEFLQSGILARVNTELTLIGVKCITEQDKNLSPTHVLLLSSGGIEETTHISPVQTTKNYHTGMDSQGNTYNYSTPSVSGGGSYSSRLAKVTAILFHLNQDGSLTKISQSFAKDDGLSFMERQLRGTILEPKKPIADVYASVFLEAALSLFEKKTE